MEEDIIVGGRGGGWKKYDGCTRSHSGNVNEREDDDPYSFFEEDNGDDGEYEYYLGFELIVVQ